jgi:Zn-dependent M28 family amino/carboxypeptidase
LAHGNAPSKVDVQADVVDLGHGEKCDYERIRAKGKIVLCDEGVAEGHRALHRTEKLSLAVENGAVGLMIYSSAPGGLPRTGVCYKGEAPIASMGISQEDGERLKRLISQGQTPTLKIAMRNEIKMGVARNVLGDLRGTTDPDEIVLAGGHLDSWDISQGSTDNGLGSAIVIEMARAIATVGQRPRRTLRFALWAAEEVGIFGSKDYVEKHHHELDNLAAVMNFDMTGDPFGFWCPGHKERSVLLQELAKQFAGLGMKEDYAWKAGLHSDHQYFMLEGVPVISLIARIEGQGGYYYHSVGDTFEKVHLPSLCRCAGVGAASMWALADEPVRTYVRMNAEEIEAMIVDADLKEALAVGV